jgi:6-phosphogluconolactonase
MPSQSPETIVLPDADALAQAAAERIAARFRAAGGRVAFCLTGGHSPERLYELLAAKPYRDTLPWDRIHIFLSDDRYVPHHDALSNFAMARRLLLDHVPLPPGSIHPIPTGAGNVDEDARRYEAELRSFYGAVRLDRKRPLFDVVLMGVGDDGHTASLFPGRPELDERERWAVGLPQAGHAPFVPRITLTFPAMASTHDMLFLVSGRGKRQIVTRVLSGADLPAARAHSHGKLAWLLDRDAQGEQCDVA